MQNCLRLRKDPSMVGHKKVKKYKHIQKLNVKTKQNINKKMLE